jgi:hypothetical protein
MGIELVLLYCVYAITGGVVVNTTISVLGDISVANSKESSEKYVACQANEKNDASTCKGLE